MHRNTGGVVRNGESRAGVVDPQIDIQQFVLDCGHRKFFRKMGDQGPGKNRPERRSDSFGNLTHSE